MKPLSFALAFVAACAVVAAAGLSLRPDGPPGGPESGPAQTPGAWPDFSVRGAGFRPPPGPAGAEVSYGHELVIRTYAVIGPEVPDPAMRFAGNNHSCSNCHLDAGTNRYALPLVGIARHYPRPAADGSTETLVDRLNRCMTRSLNGRPLPEDTREMQALLAYLRYIGTPPAADPTLMKAAPPPLPADAGRGAAVFAATCAACHQADGQGRRRGVPGDARGYAFPPLWGPDSFNDGAGMDAERLMAAFVLHNMPMGLDPTHPQLSPQQAWDVAAYVLSRPRPRYKGR